MARQETRQHILNTAGSLFYENGYNLIGINEIIEKANIAKATLYNHFSSKEDLCLAYLNQKDTELLEDLAEFTSRIPEGNERIVGILLFLEDFFNSDQFHGCWCIRTHAEVSHNEKITQQIKTNKSKFRELITSIVKDNMKSSSDQIVNNTATSVYFLYEGAVMESFLQNDVWPIQHSIKICKQLLRK